MKPLTDEKKTQIAIDIPYHGKHTGKLEKKLINLAEEINPNMSVQPIHRPAPALAHYFKIKESIPADLQANLFYRINDSNYLTSVTEFDTHSKE